MKKRPSSDVVRREMSSALLTLSQVFERVDGVVVNPDVLKSSANTVIRNARGDTWAYEVSGLLLRVNVPQNTIPANCSSPLTVQFDLEMRGECGSDPLDEVTHLILGLVITSEGGAHTCAWHLDRHIGKQESHEAHPLFHLQHGGHAMKPHADELGRSLLLPAPRMGCPPFDAVLAIDFVLSNFAGSYWQALREDSVYTRLLRESQARFWKPYWERLASWWDVGPKENAKIAELWPHLA